MASLKKCHHSKKNREHTKNFVLINPDKEHPQGATHRIQKTVGVSFQRNEGYRILSSERRSELKRMKVMIIAKDKLRVLFRLHKAEIALKLVKNTHTQKKNPLSNISRILRN